MTRSSTADTVVETGPRKSVMK